MELRDALVRRPVMPERRAAIAEAILRIEELVDRGGDATAAVETLNEMTGHSFGLDEFRYHREAPDPEALIEWACAPPPVRLPDVIRDWSRSCAASLPTRPTTGTSRRSSATP
ncbi:hypothetical protein [Dactylosporangium sp. CA-139066]|uniref:hypothetical protein n=1 Tax=Dactylosporangium sp. CA-139066 TaxID=3239930 RepID=UPI003D8FFA01